VCIFCGRELKSLVGRGRADLSVRFPFFNSSVFLRYVSGFLNRQCLDRVPTSGGGGCSKHGVVDRLLGGFNYRQKQGGHCVIRQYLDVVEDGERGRNRTFNLLIKSQLLCQLSYAPVSGLKIFRMPSRGYTSTSRQLVDCSIEARLCPLSAAFLETFAIP